MVTNLSVGLFSGRAVVEYATNVDIIEVCTHTQVLPSFFGLGCGNQPYFFVSWFGGGGHFCLPICMCFVSTFTAVRPSQSRLTDLLSAYIYYRFFLRVVLSVVNTPLCTHRSVRSRRYSAWNPPRKYYFIFKSQAFPVDSFSFLLSQVLGLSCYLHILRTLSCVGLLSLGLGFFARKSSIAVEVDQNERCTCCTRHLGSPTSRRGRECEDTAVTTTAAALS